MKNSYLISGHNGLLGSTFLKYIDESKGHAEVISREDLDITKGVDWLYNKISSFGCDVLIHCAANTNVEECEKNKIISDKVNYVLPEILSGICNRLNMKMVFISSTGIYGDYQNDPFTELDMVKPTTNHHFSKYKAEKSVESLCTNHLIIRTGWLFGGKKDNRKNFVVNRINEAKSSNGIIYSDNRQSGSPTYVDDISKRILLLIEDGLVGTYNCVNSGFATRYEYVHKIISLVDTQLIVKKMEGKFERIANVSHNEKALNYKMDMLGYPPLRSWVEALTLYVSEVENGKK